MGGKRDDSAIDIQQTNDGGYIVAGFTYSTDGDVTGNHGGQIYDDVWVVKLNATCDLVWQKTLGGTEFDECNSIQPTNDGGYILAGWTGSTIGDVTGNDGGYDSWLLKLNATGDIIWQKTLGGTLEDIAYEIQQTNDGGYILAGWTGSTIGDVTGNDGGYDSWVVKLNDNQMNTTDFSNTTLKLYPNPTNSLINIQTSNSAVLDKISITDLTGKKVMEQTQNTNQVSVEKLASGVYILNGYSEGNKFQEKFIKE